MDKIQDVEKAFDKAKEAGLVADEVWLNESDFNDLRPEMEDRDGDLYFRNLRVRLSREEQVRVGSTSCQFGKGVT